MRRMSIELIEDVTDKDNNDIFLTMNANCHAWLSLYSDSEDYVGVKLHLTPDLHGINNAKMIIVGLQNWIDQILKIYQIAN
jgi:hypothetical protein